MWILEAFGAQPMFRGMSSQSMETQQITPMQISESQLACAIMGLKLLVTLLRESHLTCDPGCVRVAPSEEESPGCMVDSKTDYEVSCSAPR